MVLMSPIYDMLLEVYAGTPRCGEVYCPRQVKGPLPAIRFNASSSESISNSMVKAQF